MYCIVLYFLHLLLFQVRRQLHSHEMNLVLNVTHFNFATLDGIILEMHDEIFHFEIFKNFMKILKYCKTIS